MKAIEETGAKVPEAYHPSERLMLDVFFGENAETEQGEKDKVVVLEALQSNLLMFPQLLLLL